MKNAIVIGAGIGGLATANLLATAGYEVTVVEKNAQAGGRAGQFKDSGFTFDTGPSWYLMPEVFEHYFSLLGLDISKQLTLTRLKPGYKVFFEDGTAMPIYGERKRDLSTFEKLEPGSSQKMTTFLHQAERMYRQASDQFLYSNFSTPSSLLNSSTFRSAPSLLTMTRRTIHNHVRRFVKNEKLQQILEYQSVFLGTSPFVAPALYTLMSHIDFDQGVFYPQGGLYEIIRALENWGRSHGVTYHYGESVRKILVGGGHTTGVQLKNGTRLLSPLVISNADLHFTETQLLPPEHQTYPESYWQKRTAGPSAILMYLGVRGKLPQLEHHNLLFTRDWKNGFDAIFNKKQWPSPASLYICVPSKTDSSVAPKGYENVFVLVPGPADTKLSSSALVSHADSYLAQIESELNIPDLRSRIVFQKLVGPDDFSNNFNAWEGTALGMAHTLRQSAMFRPRNQSRKVAGLYYVGAGTLPGIGLPMCLISAELIYKRLIGDTSSGPLKVLA